MTRLISLMCVALVLPCHHVQHLRVQAAVKLVADMPTETQMTERRQSATTQPAADHELIAAEDESIMGCGHIAPSFSDPSYAVY